MHPCLQAEPRTPTRLVVVTANAFEEDRRAALAAGSHAFIRKPFRQSDVLTCLAEQLDLCLTPPPRAPACGGAEDPAPEAPPPLPSAPPGGRALQVLLVDDNAVNRRLFLELARRLGQEVDMAVNGAEAVEAVTLQRYDVVFMDVQMPVMDGLAATQAIRRRVPAAAQPYIVALSAGQLDSERTACFLAGMDHFLPKPIRFESVQEALQTAARAGGPAHAAPPPLLRSAALMQPRDTPASDCAAEDSPGTASHSDAVDGMASLLPGTPDYSTINEAGLPLDPSNTRLPSSRASRICSLVFS